MTNQHLWKVPHGNGEAACLHGVLSEEDRNKPWLDPRDDCSAMKELVAVVLDRRFLGKVSYYLIFRYGIISVNIKVIFVVSPQQSTFFFKF